MTWLVNELSKSMEESDLTMLSLQNFVEAIGKKLTSPKSSDELQDELFEMLGFERFELIKNILLHRKEIIEQCCFETEKHEKGIKTVVLYLFFIVHFHIEQYVKIFFSFQVY